jgi:ankyrin repeat protein
MGDFINLGILDQHMWANNRFVINYMMEDQGIPGCTPLMIAAMRGHDKFVRVLLGMDNVDLDSEGRYESEPLLFFAIMEGHHEVARLLIEKGANIESQHEKYGTLLSLAIQKGHREVVQHLL